MGRAFRFHTPIHKVLEYPWKHFTFLKLCKCSQIPHPSPRVASTHNRTKTNHHQLNHLQTLHKHTLKLNHLAHDRSEGKLSNPWDNKRKSWTHLPSSFHLIKTRKTKIKLQIHPVCSFRSATPRTKKKSSPRQIKQTRVTNSQVVTHKVCKVRCFPSIAFTFLQQRQSISLVLFLKCPHLDSHSNM